MVNTSHISFPNFFKEDMRQDTAIPNSAPISVAASALGNVMAMSRYCGPS